jgi:hypothetical protein
VVCLSVIAKLQQYGGRGPLGGGGGCQATTKKVYYPPYSVKNHIEKKNLQTDTVDHNEIYILHHVPLFFLEVPQIILVHIPSEVLYLVCENFK